MTAWGWVWARMTATSQNSSLAPYARAGTLTSRRAGITALPIVFAGGVNLILIQWVLVREMTTLLLGTELVVLLVSLSYFAGLSVGYVLAGKIRRKWLIPLGTITLVVHLTLPIWFRLVVVGLSTLGAYWAAFFILPLLTPFLVSAFYSIFLPLFVDQGDGKLSRLYLVEILGSGAGILVLVLLSGLGLQVVYAVYSAGLLVILAVLGVRLSKLILPSLLVIIWLTVLPSVNYWSNSLWYVQMQGLPEGTTTLYSGYSPYQKVDVLQSPDGGMYLYLDGLSHFSSPDGIRLNVVIGQIPAVLFQPRTALVVGAGVMQTEQLIADYADQVTTVEIDPLVVEVGKRYFAAFNKMNSLTNRDIVVDDAKHFLANTDQKYDLVVTDTPAAFALQTATLYSLPFYKEIADHLTTRGILVANMTSSFTSGDVVSRRIAATLLAQFKEVIVITPASVGWSFAYAGDHLPFNRRMLETALRRSGEGEFTLFDTEAVKVIAGDARPITLDSMDFVLQTSLNWIGDRFTWR